MIFYLKSVSLYLTITKVQTKNIEVAIHVLKYIAKSCSLESGIAHNVGRKRNLRKHPKLINLAQQNHIDYKDHNKPQLPKNSFNMNSYAR